MNDTSPLRVEEWTLDKIRPYEKNPRCNDAAVKKVANSIREFGWRQPIVVDKRGVIVIGHTRLKAAQALGLKTAPVHVAANLTDKQIKALRLADNKTAELATWDFDLLGDELAALAEDFDMSDFGFEVEEDNAPLDDSGDGAPVSLEERFGVPPFSILHIDREPMLSRHKAWIARGIRSELGRGGVDNVPTGTVTKNGQIRGAKTMKDGLIFKSSSGADPSSYRQKKEIEARLGKRLSTDDFERNYYQPGKNSTLSDTGTSIFNAALCEILLSWFSREGDSVLDPFAGGSVRGIVANSMGRRYTGVELRAEQVDANRVQGAAICSGNEPRWICGDSAGIDDLAGDAAPYDFILTCPPYGDLEVYSDDPHDLSAMPQEAFGAAYASILRKTVALLAPDRFAAVVVGNYRDARGFLVDLAGMTVRMMETAGAGYYNDFIVVQPAGSLPIRVSKQFLASRKCGRRHQFALIFCKGSPKRATDRLGAPFLPEEIAEEDTPPQ